MAERPVIALVGVIEEEEPVAVETLTNAAAAEGTDHDVLVVPAEPLEADLGAVGSGYLPDGEVSKSGINESARAVLVSQIVGITPFLQPP
ncbi:hypothetical protein [Actinomyces procaprae]|uniref:hypothetical protein n=1 Tax=Actinomyces procaprae TaxID=2560010 RepID=UPI00109E1F4E|nr:hypothetical protein [Actinomyces procaprae]